MDEVGRSRLNHSRAGFGAIPSGLGGGLAPVVLVLRFTACRWLITGATEFDRRADLVDLRKNLTPRFEKGPAQPPLYPFESIFPIIVRIVMAAILATIRICGASSSSPSRESRTP